MIAHCTRPSASPVAGSCCDLADTAASRKAKSQVLAVPRTVKLRVAVKTAFVVILLATIVGDRVEPCRLTSLGWDNRVGEASGCWVLPDPKWQHHHQPVEPCNAYDCTSYKYLVHDISYTTLKPSYALPYPPFRWRQTRRLLVREPTAR